ncbi:serine protease inhibitor [Pseudarthrobacter sp. N5]|uniref:serine protease inhibitor n=1 Tax=Pseudarthrobacter sp. N5 TaxID=3418416 RepID=UPI003CEF99DF
MTAPDAEPDVDLTVTLTDAPGARAYEFRLVARGGQPTPESTLPVPGAALAAVERFGAETFFAVRRPDMLCTQQYGGPQVAVVTGRYLGRQVHCRFSLTDGCEISRWRAVAPLLGGTAGSTGQI